MLVRREVGSGSDQRLGLILKVVHQVRRLDVPQLVSHTDSVPTEQSLDDGYWTAWSRVVSYKSAPASHPPRAPRSLHECSSGSCTPQTRWRCTTHPPCRGRFPT